MRKNQTNKPILLVQGKCTSRCPYYMPVSIKLTQEQEDVCRVTADGKGRCWVNENTMQEKCDCQLPELGVLLAKYETMGICKNCGHFIIKNKKWEHYYRPYTCRIPYSGVSCNAPKGYINETRDLPTENDPYDLILQEIQRKTQKESNNKKL